MGLGDADEACGSFAAQFDWFDCHFSGGGGGGGGVGRGPSTNPFDRCSYTSTNDASCASPPGLWSNGQPIYGTSGGSVLNINGLGGGGGPWGESLGIPYGLNIPPPSIFPTIPGPSGCEFGTCGTTPAMGFKSPSADEAERWMGQLSEVIDANKLPFVNIMVSGAFFVTGGVVIAAGGAAIVVGCVGGGPLGCAAGVMGGAPAIGGGWALWHWGYQYTRQVTIPGIKGLVVPKKP